MVYEAFHFTGEQWAEIESELDGRRLEDEHLSQEHIEERIGEWKGMASLKTDAAVLVAARTAAQSLLKVLHAEAAKKFLSPPEKLSADLNKLVAAADSWLRESGNVNRSNSHRDYLIDLLIQRWLMAGGDIRTSKKLDDMPDGPLIRFLIKVSRAAGIVGLTEHMAAARVRKQRRGLVRLLKVNDAEAVFAKFRAGLELEWRLKDMKYLQEKADAEHEARMERLKEENDRDLERYLYEYD
jgi:hypothetical protein